MNRILIVYDTRGGSTGEIIGWMREGAVAAGAVVEIRTAADPRPTDFDVIVVGTPIYGGKPMDSVVSFLARDDLRGKDIALFVVCYAGVFGLRNFMVRRYLDELEAVTAGRVVLETSFDAAKGPWRKLNREICIDFGRELAGRPAHRPRAVKTT